MTAVSVIVPVYNSEAYLRSCLDSILSQSLRNIEVLCIDDGSKDGSVMILQEYAEKDTRVRVIRMERNTGLGQVRNLGIMTAQGAYVSFLDSDDLYEADMLEKMYRCAKENDLTGVYGDMKKQAADPEAQAILNVLPSRHGSYNDRVYTGKELLQRFWDGGEWLCFVQCQMWKRAYLTENDIYFTEGVIHEDEFFAFKAAFLAPRVMHSPGAYFIYRVHSSGITLSSGAEKHFRGYLKTYLQITEMIEREDLRDSCAWVYLNNMYGMMMMWAAALPADHDRDTLLVKYLPHSAAEVFFNERDKSGMQVPEGTRRVWLYGAGGAAASMYRRILGTAVLRNTLMAGFIVSDGETHPMVYMGAPVITLSEYPHQPDDMIIIAVSEKYAPEIREKLDRLNYVYIG